MMPVFQAKSRPFKLIVAKMSLFVLSETKYTIQAKFYTLSTQYLPPKKQKPIQKQNAPTQFLNMLTFLKTKGKSAKRTLNLGMQIQNQSHQILHYYFVQMQNQSNGHEHLNKMHQLAMQSRSKAYCPYSNFAVGSCILGSNGKFYTGCNVEKAVCSLCAQQTAIAKMVEDGCRQIKEVYVVTILSGEQLAAPCGYCRQYIKEFSHNDEQLKVHLGSVQKGYEITHNFAFLFPVSFGPSSLGKPLP